MGATAPKRKKRKLKKSARRTIAALLMVTAVIIAAIPVQDVKAEPSSATALGLPTGLSYFDQSGGKWIGNAEAANLSVPNVSANAVDGYLLNDDGTCVVDGERHLPIPLYKIDKTADINNAALTGYNLDAIYLITGGVLPLHNKVGFESESNPITQTVRYTYEEQDVTVTENVVMIEKTTDVVYDELGVIVSGTVPAKFKRKEIIEPYRCVDTALITCIADGALAGKTNFTAIKIPDYIKKIGNEAFKGCTALKTVEIGNNLTFIGNEAFAECGDLNSFTFVQPSSCKTLGTAAFGNCGNLTVFEFPSSIVESGHGLFYGCEALANVEMSTTSGGNTMSAYKTIGDYTFMNCKNLSSVTLCPNLEAMGNYTFAGCEYLLNATMPANKAITFPQDTFWNCWNLDYVKVMNTSSVFADKEEFSSIPVFSDFYIWGPDPNTNPSAIYTYAADLTANYTYFYEDSSGEGHYEKTKNGFKFTVDNTGKINGFKVTDAVSAGSTLDIPDVIGPYDVKTIGNNCFNSSVANISKVRVVNIPSTIVSAGVGAFSGMPSLETVNIETDGIALDTECFKDCPNLKTVNFTQVTNPASATTIGTRCFQGCRRMESISFRNDDFTRGAIYDVNVIDGGIGENAFDLQRATGELIMKGRIDSNYEPFKFAMNPNNKINESTKPYIKYISGNPTNLECMYDPSLNDGAGAVSLLTYPSMDTEIGTISGNTYKVSDIVPGNAPFNDPLSQVQSDILDSTQRIVVPAVITSIANTTQGTQDYFRSAPDKLATVTLMGVTSLPTKTISGSVSGNNGAFANNNKDLTVVNFGADVTDIGTLPFYDSTSIVGVNFSDAETSPGTLANKYYWCEKGIIYSSYIDDAGEEVVTLEEVLPSRGMQGGSEIHVTADEVQSITQIAERAFQNCDYVTTADFSTASKLRAIPKDCFYECSNLKEVILPASVNDIDERAFSECYDYIEVTVPATEVYINDSAFSGTSYATIYSYEDSAAERYANRHTNVTFMKMKDNFIVTFADYDGTVIETQTVVSGEDAVPPANPVRTGYTFTGWKPTYTAITSDRTCVAQYTSNSSTGSSTSTPSGSTSNTSNTSTTSSRTSTTRTTSSSSRSTSSSSTSSSSSSTSSSSSSTTKVITSSTAARTSTGRTGNTGSNGNNSNTTGNGGTKVIANTSGISDIGKISATVNGSTDSYVIKITDSAEATAAVEKALLAEYGTLDNLRYLPMDISIYDSTGTTKISPLPDGISVSITLPLPDDLAIYGGNAKPANAEGGVLSKMNPRFTVIGGVPCMTFTATHFSPYVIYVDTTNLSAAGSQDITPVTGDPIHPKWFLVIGLAAIAVVLFLKRDSEDRLKMA